MKCYSNMIDIIVQKCGVNFYCRQEIFIAGEIQGYEYFAGCFKQKAGFLDICPDDFIVCSLVFPANIPAGHYL